MDPANSLNIKLDPTKVSTWVGTVKTNVRPYYLHYIYSTYIRLVKDISCFRVLKKYITNALCSDFNGKLRPRYLFYFSLFADFLNS